MKQAEAMRTISKAYHILRDIENESDLKKYHLSLSDYAAAKNLFNDLSKPGAAAKTIIKNVANFYENCGFLVFETGISYTITT